MPQFSDFVAGGVLAAWNITFEYGFLLEAFTRANIPDPMDYHRIDIPTLAWSRFPRLEHFSQNDIAKLLGLPMEPEPHRAITGAEYALIILRALRNQ
jgi:DNA polymerase III alpha subunit (gram-positive type)